MPESSLLDPASVELVAGFKASVARGLTGSVPEQLGVAVSGGGDSVALLLLLQDWSQETGCRISAVTVDHGLRDGSDQEAANVGTLCQRLGVSHNVLTWADWDGVGNLQQAAREARYGLMANWARAMGIEEIALGHTRDDQAETVLMRLARGSGVDGLSAMGPRRYDDGVDWWRPLLDFPRDGLRNYLRSAGVGWVDDPSNDNERFERVRVRNLLEQLAPLGVDTQALAETAGRMASARQALAQYAVEAARRIATVDGGAVFFDIGGFSPLVAETRRRLLSQALCWVSGQAYPPRAAALADLETSLTNGAVATLHGCLIGTFKGRYFVAREANAVVDITCDPGQLWDARWRLLGPEEPGQVIRATGETGLKSCPDWKQTGLPRLALLASPAVWQGEELVAAPVAGLANGWRAEMRHNGTDFVTSIISH